MAVSKEAETVPAAIREGVPEWDDQYLSSVAERLLYNYDLEREYRAAGRRWTLYGAFRAKTQKQFFHPALSYADHETEEHLLVEHTDRPTVQMVETLVDDGHDLADSWIDPDEEHYGTDITFVVIADSIPESVADYVSGFRDRTLLKFGYYGHYEINLVVVAPDKQTCIASQTADVAAAFRLWDDVSESDDGLLSRVAKRFWR
ncbi:hypothetical protein DP106_03880 [Halonotius pteroides]|uniref:DUF8052 domain-containing protein n=1 Tax=Halonotius pteroides TaxID=268735 RepID=A0A3A6QR62_9EURY|nr:hypothetical protein DP106_03880 [Halonotius pteroides]